MFVVTTQDEGAKQKYWTPVEVNIPKGDGTHTKHKFKVQFNRLTQEEIDEIHRRMDPLRLEEGEDRLTDNELVKKVLAGWDETVCGADSEKLEFNDDNMAAFLSIYPTRGSVVTAWFKSVKQSIRKN